MTQMIYHMCPAEAWEEAVAAGEYFERFKPGGDDFGTDAIAGDRGNFVFAHGLSQ